MSTAMTATSIGPPETGRGRSRPPRELLGIDQLDARAERVDAESLPGQVQERQAGNDGEIHPAVVAQQLDGAFGHQG
jgi:hypothetical protein